MEDGRVAHRRSPQPFNPHNSPRSMTAPSPSQSRWSVSTAASVAPSFHATSTADARTNLPPLATTFAVQPYDEPSSQPPSTFQHPSAHGRNRSVPSSSRAPSSVGPSRPPSQMSVARTMSSRSGEIPIMLQIDEDIPAVPPLPHGTNPAPIAHVLDDVDLSYSPHPLPDTAATQADYGVRRTEIDVPSSILSGPRSAPLAQARDFREPLHSKYHVKGSSSQARSAATSIMQTPVSASPRVPPPAKSRTVTGPPSSFKPPRQPSPARPNTPKSIVRPSKAASNASSLLTRLGTNLRKSLRSPAKYRRLDDDNEREIPLQQVDHQHDKILNDDDDFMPIAFDISTFEGPAHFQTKPSTRMQQHVRQASSDDVEDNASVLEAKGTLTGGLGGGMGEVVEAQMTMPPNHKPSVRTLPKPKQSLARRTASKFRQKPPPLPTPMSQAGQEVADKSGQVVAVEEATVDLSNVEGFLMSPDRSQDINLIAEEATAKQSFYFPPDPQMPNWRPLPMQRWYLILLILIATTFVGVAEHLVQASTDRGLISFTSPTEINDGMWFVWKYLGEILLTSYGVMFQATDFEVRRLEPYYQMSKSTGAAASESLNMDYLTFWSYLIPFKAFSHRQWAVVCSSLSTILASAVIPVLYSAAVNLNPPRGQRNWQPGQPPIVYQVQMDPTWTRLLEAALLAVIVGTGLLLFQQRRKSGLTGDLKGIAGIATMATKSHILNEFKGLDLADHQSIHKQLAHRRFILHKGTLWQGEYITKPTSDSDELPKPKNPHPVVLHLPIGFIFMFGLVLFIALIPIIEFNQHVNVVTDAAPWFLPLLATFVKLVWTNLETGVRMIEPFYHLSTRHAPPSTLLLDYTGTIPGYMPIKALYNKHFLLASIGIGALLGEVLTVCVSSFNVDGTEFLNKQTTPEGFNPSGDGETKRSFFISFVLAEIIPIVMLVVLVFVYLRRRHAFLPRQPGTIASVLAFVHQSKMLYDFVADDDEDDLSASPTKSLRPESLRRKSLRKSATWSTLKTAANLLSSEADQDMDRAERAVRNLQLRQKSYGLGWFRGRDGQSHVGIDEEELMLDYQHGVNYKMAHMDASEIGRWDQY